MAQLDVALEQYTDEQLATVDFDESTVVIIDHGIYDFRDNEDHGLTVRAARFSNNSVTLTFVVPEPCRNVVSLEQLEDHDDINHSERNATHHVDVYRVEGKWQNNQISSAIFSEIEWLKSQGKTHQHCE